MFLKKIKEKYGKNTLSKIKNYIKINKNICKYEKKKNFLLSCRSRNLKHKKLLNITNNLKTIHFHSQFAKLKTEKIIKNLQNTILNLEIKDIHIHLRFLYKQKTNIENTLKNIVSPNTFNSLINFNKSQPSSSNNENTNRLKNKLQQLNDSQCNNLKIFGINQHSKFNQNFDFNSDPWLINISSTPIPTNVHNFLRLGQDFSNASFQNKKTQIFELVKDFENHSYKIPYDVVDEIRHIVINQSRSFLSNRQKTSPFDNFIYNNILETKSFLKNNPDIFVSRADKGNVSVVASKKEYINSMKKIFENINTYLQLDSNPVITVQNRIFNLLNGWRNKKYLNPSIERKQILTDNTNLPRAYGLYKIHKNGFPLRTIISCIDSPLSFISNLYKDILTAACPHPSNVVKNSYEFKNKIKDTTIPKNYNMVSYDIFNMFNNIPLDLVKISIIKRWSLIEKFTNLPQKEFLKGLEVIMNSLYFQFDNKYYQQINGLPMGLSLSPILADLVIQDIEEIVLNTFKTDIISYSKYVDDSIMIVKNNMLHPILDMFNSFHPNIQFAYELENNNVLNFLDILLIKNIDGTITTDIYKKPTFSGRYLNFLSHHSMSTKIGIIKNLRHKIVQLSDSSLHQKNFQQLKNDLVLNNFPKQFINRIFTCFLNQLDNNNNNTQDNSKPDFKNTIVLKLIPIISDNIKHTIKSKCNINTVYRAPFKLNCIIKPNKDPLQKENNKNLIYKINCKDCDKAYVGQTKRFLKTRTKEHKDNIKLKESYHNVITKHILKHNHNFDFTNVQILHKETNFFKRSFAEMVYIDKQGDNKLNANTDCEKLKDSYKALNHKL